MSWIVVTVIAMLALLLMKIVIAVIAMLALLLIKDMMKSNVSNRAGDDVGFPSLLRILFLAILILSSLFGSSSIYRRPFGGMRSVGVANIGASKFGQITTQPRMLSNSRISRR